MHEVTTARDAYEVLLGKQGSTANARVEVEAELQMKRDVRADKYVALNDKRSKVNMGVADVPVYNNDRPLYGAMGFVRSSEIKSGLTRKAKPLTGGQ